MDSEILKAVSNIVQRAERMIDDAKIQSTYEEIGVIPLLNNRNNQIIYGRRGTGKTHVFKYLASELKIGNDIVVYVDCRTLSSASSFEDSRPSRKYRSHAIFRDIIGEIEDAVKQYIALNAPNDSVLALDALEQMIKATSIKESKKRDTRKTEVRGRTTTDNVGMKVSIPQLTLDFDSKVEEESTAQTTTSYRMEEHEKLVFPDINYKARELVQHLKVNIYVLLDEWSSIPLDVQPFLADCINKSFFAIPHFIFKIAALEYRSNFTIVMQNNLHIGFELGSDISSNLDLDDYFVFDKNPDSITAIFAGILSKHIKSELPEGYLDKIKVTSTQQVINYLFSNRAVFKELVRASEGVPRDMINIFNLAYFDAQKQNKNKIDKPIILSAARDWFEKDKFTNIDDSLNYVLQRIVTEVIGNRKARSFLIRRELERNDVIQRLFDARVIHFVKRGYADKDNPGVRYNIYTLDYGTYVDLLKTAKKPDGYLPLDENMSSRDIVVPFDDKRSIRRIILTEEMLKLN